MEDIKGNFNEYYMESKISCTSGKYFSATVGIKFL